MVSVLFPWNTDGRPDQVAGLNWVSCPILSQMYTPMAGTIMRVFVVSYTHGHIFSVPSRLVCNPEIKGGLAWS